MKRALLVVLVGLVATPAWAQTVDDPTPIVVTSMSPTSAKLNAAACDDTPVPITATLEYGGFLTLPATLNVWWQTGVCSDSTIVKSGEAGHVGSFGISLIETFSPFSFPADLDADPEPEVTTGLVMQTWAEACGDTEVEQTIYLCFAIDQPSGYDNQTNGQVDATEPYTQIAFRVDTKPPPAPNTPKLTAYDGSIEVKLSAADDDDIAEWKARYRSAVDDGSTSCEDWPAGGFSETRAQASSTISLDGVSNGTTYEVCGFALDAVGNQSAASATATAAPAPECSFWECYPEDKKPEVGYGCAALAPPAWAGALLLGLLIRRRRGRA